MGGGGQLGNVCRNSFASVVNREFRQRSRIILSWTRTGVDVGHANKTGTSGVIEDLVGSLDAIRERGIRGRLIKLCQGQFEGSSESKRSNILQ